MKDAQLAIKPEKSFFIVQHYKQFVKTREVKTFQTQDATFSLVIL